VAPTYNGILRNPSCYSAELGMVHYLHLRPLRRFGPCGQGEALIFALWVVGCDLENLLLQRGCERRGASCTCGLRSDLGKYFSK
jgi:hypothetical protein